MEYCHDEEWLFADIYHEEENEMSDYDPEPRCWLCDRDEDVCECTKAELTAAWQARPLMSDEILVDPFADEESR